MHNACSAADLIGNGGKQLDSNTIVGAYGNKFVKQADGSYANVGQASQTEISQAGVVVRPDPKGGVNDILAGGQRLPNTGGPTTQIQKSGGFDQANADFDSLGLSNVRDIQMKNGGSGRVGELPDGTKVVVRSGSSENRPGFTSQPTLEIQYTDGATKVRY